MFILLTEDYLDKTSLTTFTLVSITMVFFAARATDSTTKVALAKTDIRFIHMLIITIALIGFEMVRAISNSKTGLEGFAPSTCNLGGYHAIHIARLSTLRHKPSKKNTCSNLSLIKLANFLLNVNNLHKMFG